ncbi:MAG TPA: xanthine dehydrogenase family protein molybdopterin-binding subunit [Candidatus Tyrphobacter sp.]
MNLPLVGAPYDRLDGPAKVTGAATYAADFSFSGLVHAAMVTSEIANGRILRIDDAEARRQDGVLAVMTHENAPRVHAEGRGFAFALMLLQDARIHYDRQPIAVVVAESFEQATYAASLLRTMYETQPPVTRIEDSQDRYTPEEIFGDPADVTRGDPDGAFAAAPVRLERVYSTPVEHHNPMEPSATIAQWEGDRLTVHDATQGITNVRRRLATVFGIPAESIRVVSPYLGGGFGCKGGVWSHVALAAMAAREVGRPVKLVLTRPQMFGSIGYRPRTIQRISLGADRDGRLRSIAHDVLSQTSTFDEFVEPSALVTKMLYAVENVHTTHELARVNAATPTFMRAPGEASGTFALESAMDELSYAVDLDPIELRLRNYAERDLSEDKPFSSKGLRECYRLGAQKFGWSQRDPKPRSMRDGRMLVGMGMAGATYPVNRAAASATVRIDEAGGVVVRSGTQDLGTGSYTVYAQVAAEVLGVSIDRVRVELGDTELPPAPLSAGSMTATSVGSAVYEAASALRERLRNGEKAPLEARADSKPPEHERYSKHAFGAQFARVDVDPDLGIVRVRTMVGAFAAGRILNAKTARSQYLGGMIWGIGMALHEITSFDARTGRIVNANLSDYLVPVHADAPEMEAYIVEEEDSHVNPIGVKGIGEIGITGVAAAIANAVYHATGVRVRDLPIAPEMLLA